MYIRKLVLDVYHVKGELRVCFLPSLRRRMVQRWRRSMNTRWNRKRSTLSLLPCVRMGQAYSVALLSVSFMLNFFFFRTVLTASLYPSKSPKNKRDYSKVKKVRSSPFTYKTLRSSNSKLIFDADTFQSLYHLFLRASQCAKSLVQK